MIINDINNSMKYDNKDINNSMKYDNIYDKSFPEILFDIIHKKRLYLFLIETSFYR